MDAEHGRAQPPASSSSWAHAKPLHLRKASYHAQLVRSHPKYDIHQDILNKPIYPSRTSATCNHPAHCDSSPAQPDATRIKTLSPDLKAEKSSINAATLDYSHLTPYEYSMKSTTGNPTISSSKSRHISPTMVSQNSHYHSSEIMGDFVPIDSPNMAGLQPDMDPDADILQGLFKPPRVNPFVLEPSTLHSDSTSQTTFIDFKNGQGALASLTPRSAHVRNARSEENATRTQDTTHLPVTPRKAQGFALHRSESSPNISQLPYHVSRGDTPSPNILQYYLDGRRAGSSPHRGHEDFLRSPSYQDQKGGVEYSSQYPSLQQKDSSQERLIRSPSRHMAQGPLTKGHQFNRSRTRSPTTALDYVSEREEYNDSPPARLSGSPPTSPKKRSRSPMKKMFGENGWLGTSPNEMPDLKSRGRSFVTHVDFPYRPKKVGMMEKLRIKFDEIAERADLSPIGRARPNADREKQAVLSISLGPPEQARIYMEIELMLLHSANSFLMSQFSQGRMDINSIKKTVDVWKSKGRPIVIEFMYDQTTQRDLVVANQQNLRFHGCSAGSDLRINSMLYNWKQVVQLMLIRTFCNADTVILKLLFDIEQILELLGAMEPILIRLQQIRATATETMRLSRHRKESKANSQRSFTGREPPCNSKSSIINTLYGMDDLYGGMKLVPDHFEG